MKNALFIGRSVLDVFSLVEDFPKPDGKTKALANDLIPGGSSLNAAVTFSHLGGDAALATSLGAQGLTRSFVMEDLNTHGVTVFDICGDPEYTIPISTVISTKTLGARMIVNGSQDDCHLIDNNQKVFDKDFDLLQIDQYERYFIEQNYENIRSFDGTIVLDGGSWKDWSTDFLRLADIPIVSEVFLKDGLGHFAEMCHEIGLPRWAVTRGINGVIWQDGTASGEIPAVGVDTIDTLGAGDVFHGAFCYYYANTGNFVQSLERANQIAANSCKSVGTRSWMSA